MSSIFGKPSQSNSVSTNQSTSTSDSSSNNQAYPWASQIMGGQLDNGTQASDSLSALLGVGGDSAAQSKAFDQWKGSTGYQAGLNQGVDAITGSAATKGLLNSGSTAKGVNTFGQNYANQQFQNYTNPMQALIGSSNQAGSVISGMGQQSQSTSQAQSTGASKSNEKGAKQGIGGFLGALM